MYLTLFKIFISKNSDFSDKNLVCVCVRPATTSRKPCSVIRRSQQPAGGVAGPCASALYKIIKGQFPELYISSAQYLESRRSRSLTGQLLSFLESPLMGPQWENTGEGRWCNDMQTQQLQVLHKRAGLFKVDKKFNTRILFFFKCFNFT